MLANEKVAEGGVVMSRAVLIAVGVDWDGRRQILGVEMPNRESRSSWKGFLLGLRRRGLNGVEFVVADDLTGLRASVREVSPRSPSRGAMSTSCATPSTACRARPTTTACRSCAGSTTGARSRKTRRDLSAWIAEWSARYPKLVAWVEEIIEETLTFYRLPLQHQKHLKSTNVLERLNGEIRLRTYVVRIFPNSDACRCLVRALVVETHENWLEAHRYLKMNDLKELKKTQFRQAA